MFPQHKRALVELDFQRVAGLQMRALAQFPGNHDLAVRRQHGIHGRTKDRLPQGVKEPLI